MANNSADAMVAAAYAKAGITPSSNQFGGSMGMSYSSPVDRSYWTPSPAAPAYTPPAAAPQAAQGGYTQSPSNYYPTSQPASAAQAMTAQPAQRTAPAAPQSYAQIPSNYDSPVNPYQSTQAPIAMGRGPQVIPLGTPGTYMTPGGRVGSETQRRIAIPQRAFAAGAGNGQSLQDYMTSKGFGTNFFTGGSMAGVSTDGWSWDTMSSPAMDRAAGKSPLIMGDLGYRG